MRYSKLVMPLTPRYSIIRDMTDCWAISSQAYRHGDAQFRVQRIREDFKRKPSWEVTRWDYVRDNITGTWCWMLTRSLGIYLNRAGAFAAAGAELAKAWTMQQLGRDNANWLPEKH